MRPITNRLPRMPLTESAAAADPLILFGRWFADAEAAALPLSNAMTLATVGRDGRPSARMVLLKGVEDGGFVFFTNYDSRKGQELAHCPHACLVFHWSSLDRQVRIEGMVERIADAASDAYFDSRPLGSRRSAWASPQSTVIPDRRWLESRVEECARRFGSEPPRPAYWGGYRLRPNALEFWQGRDDRLHDRLSYRFEPEHGWRLERLAP